MKLVKMKFIIYSLIIVSLLACERNIPEKEVNEKDLITLKFKEKALFYNVKDTMTYFIQYLDHTNIELDTYERIEYDKKDNSINFYKKNNKVLKIGLNQNVFGIGKTNTFNFNNFITKNISLVERSYSNYYDFSSWYDEPEVEEVKCGCISQNATRKPKNCDSGGAGSTQCAITDAGGAATISWNNHCATSCGSGYYSCCVKGNGFEY
jgi:hypothetical protein